MESVIWFYHVRNARDKYDLVRFDSLGEVKANDFRGSLAPIHHQDGHRRWQLLRHTPSAGAGTDKFDHGSL